jgi:hypothetical protein
MKSNKLRSQHQKISWLLEQANAVHVDQIELKSHLARYICVVTSGFLENAIKEIFTQYAKNRSSPTIADYIEGQLAIIKTPKSSKFIEVAGAFNKAWGVELEKFLSEEGRKEAIDSIISNRHLIAHGKDAGITLASLKSYLAKCVDIVEYLEEKM